MYIHWMDTRQLSTMRSALKLNAPIQALLYDKWSNELILPCRHIISDWPLLPLLMRVDPGDYAAELNILTLLITCSRAVDRV